MDDRDIIHHLLAVESEAASLASDAEAEADRRVAERERAARSVYDATYSARAAELEEDARSEAEAVLNEYRQDLEAYRASLEKAPTDGGAFTRLVENLFFGER
jgi:vacuolar-type H+-ATPase subunit H